MTSTPPWRRSTASPSTRTTTPTTDSTSQPWAHRPARWPPATPNPVRSFRAAVSVSAAGRSGAAAAPSRAVPTVHHQVVHPPADEFDDLVARARRRARAGERLGSLRAPPVELGPPSPQSRRFHSRSREVTCPRSSVWCSSRIGTCQHTLGFQSSGRSPASSAAMWSAHPTPPSNPGRFRKMQASSTKRVAVVADPSASGSPVRRKPFLTAFAWNCMCSGRTRTNADTTVCDVVVVDEVGAVAAAALREVLGRRRRARPGTPRRRCSDEFESRIRRVEHPGALLLGVLERDPLVEVVGRAVGSRGVRHRRARYSSSRRSRGTVAGRGGADGGDASSTTSGRAPVSIPGEPDGCSPWCRSASSSQRSTSPS